MKNNTCKIAPVEVEIFVNRGSVHKIITDNGRNAPENT